MIYGLLDYELIQAYDVDIEDFLSFCKKIDAKIVQYRDKNSSFEEVKQRLLYIRGIWQKKLIINDYVELAGFCDGVHVGQEDLAEFGSVEKIRKIIGKNKILGLSTHNKEEILQANKMDLDYIGLGAYRQTTTKKVSFVGGKELEELAKLSIHPVAMIGGVRLGDEIKNISYKVIGSDICKSISTQ